MEFKQKIKITVKHSGLTYAKFAEKTSISLSSLKKYAGGEIEPSLKSIVKIIDQYPQYTLWLMTNEVAPEVGQISPDQEMPQLMSNGVPEKLLDDTFDKTIETSVALGWLTPKEDIKMSMLADLHRHNFVEAGGVFLSQEPMQERDKTG